MPNNFPGFEANEEILFVLVSFFALVLVFALFPSYEYPRDGK